jgi:hypothetical protein
MDRLRDIINTFTSKDFCVDNNHHMKDTSTSDRLSVDLEAFRRGYLRASGENKPPFDEYFHGLSSEFEFNFHRGDGGGALSLSATAASGLSSAILVKVIPSISC